MATNPNNPEFWSDAKVVDTSNPAYWSDAKVVEAPNNTVFDEKNNRVLSLPQTVNADEVDYLIKRDVDGQKDLFGGVSIGNGGDLGSFLGRSLRMPTLGDVNTGVPEAFASGALGFATALPQAAFSLVQEQAQLSQEQAQAGGPLARPGRNVGMQVFRDNILNAFGGADKIDTDMASLIERSKRYLEKAGFNRPESGAIQKFAYDLGSGGASFLTSLGIAAATRSPATASVFFGALQKSQIYQEAVAAGKTAGEASDLSSLSGFVEGGLEFIGLDAFMKGMRGNSAVQRFLNGFIIEGAQEGTQTASEEAITQLSGIRDKGMVETAQDILYSGFIGGVIGGTTNAAIGGNVMEDAKAAGFTDAEAKALGEYAKNNVDIAKQDMAEFIRKEVMPIAEDDATAKEFITLMQKFENNVEVANIADLDQNQRAVFDKFIEQFNNATVDVRGVAAVEKAVFDNAVAGGLNQEEAVAASKFVGARADAASRALGVTPEQWWASQNLRLERRDRPEDVTLNAEETLKPNMVRVYHSGSVGDGDSGRWASTNKEYASNYRPDSPLFYIDIPATDARITNKDIPEQGIKEGFTFNFELTKEEAKNLKEIKRAPELGQPVDTTMQAAPEEDFLFQEQTYTADTINIDGVERPTKNSNGQPIAQTEEGLRNFWRWFGDSKVVDAEGKPLVVYHVSRNKTPFDVFRTENNTQSGELLNASFFSEQYDYALEYASVLGKTKEDVGYFYLNSTNPSFVVLEDGKFSDPTEEKAVIEKARKDGFDSSNLKSPNNEDSFWAVFKPNQIKSVDNVGTFNPNDARLLYQSGQKQTETPPEGKVYLYRGLQREFDPSFDLANTDAPNGYSTWTDSPELARQYAGENGFVYRIELSKEQEGKEPIDAAGERVLFFDNEKKAGLNGVSGKEYLVYNFHDSYSPDLISLVDNNVLNQGSARAPRGQTAFFRDGRKIITLFKDANASTIIHELGHVFLRDMQAVSKSSIRPRVKKDYEVIKQWLGMKDDRFTVQHEEKYARGFELFVREGKAPKPELNSVFERFSEWLKIIYRSVRDLNVEINDDVRQVFDRMLGGDFRRTEAVVQRREKNLLDKDYEIVAGSEPPVDIAGSVNTLGRNLAELTSDVFAPVSTRLGNIDGRLREIVRRFLFETGVSQVEDKRLLEPFYNRVHKEFSKPDYRILDLALKNRDTEKVNELVAKYGIEVEWAKVRDVLDRIYTDAQEAGLEIRFVEEYFPRMVKRDKVGDFLAMLRNKPHWSEVEAGLKEADPNNTMTDEEKVDWINSFLRGFSSARINIAKPSFTKERTIDYVTPDMNVYYERSLPTLLKYVSAMRATIEQKKLFGKGEKDKDKSIGAYVRKMVEQGAIDQSREQEVKDLLKAVVDARGTRGFVTWTKNIGYIGLMGNPISTLTQIGDLAFSAYKNGYYNAIKGFFKSVTGKQMLTKEDLGIDNVLQEFEDETKSGMAVRKVFKAVGLEFMDNVGKETFIDSTYARLVKQNKKGGAEWDAYLDTLFGDEAASVKKDLAEGRITENVKFMLFSELSNIQPISLAEMPVAYLQGGNGRIFYMLKSYTIKQIDLYRREIFSKMASGNVKETAEGVRNLVALSAALMLAGMASDALKDLLLGREIYMDDLVADNILKLLTISKYQLYKGKEENLAHGFINTFMVGIPTALQDSFSPVPITVVNDVLKDTYRVITREDRTIADSRVPTYVPVLGKFYYWWWGGGRKKEEDEQARREREARQERQRTRSREE